MGAPDGAESSRGWSGGRWSVVGRRSIDGRIDPPLVDSKPGSASTPARYVAPARVARPVVLCPVPVAQPARVAQPATDRRCRADEPVSYTHLRAHETVLDLVCRLLLEKKKK